MASLMMSGNAWKGVIAAACEGTVSLLQGGFLEHGGDKSWPWLQMASQASLCLPLTACWSFLLLVLVLQPGAWRQPFRFSSAIPLPADRSCLNLTLEVRSLNLSHSTASQLNHKPTWLFFHVGHYQHCNWPPGLSC